MQRTDRGTLYCLNSGLWYEELSTGGASTLSAEALAVSHDYVWMYQNGQVWREHDTVSGRVIDPPGQSSNELSMSSPVLIAGDDSALAIDGQQARLYNVSGASVIRIGAPSLSPTLEPTSFLCRCFGCCCGVTFVG